MLGDYDVVHVQLLVNIVKDNDPAPLVRNLMSLLSKSQNTTILLSTCSFARKGWKRIAVGRDVQPTLFCRIRNSVSGLTDTEQSQAVICNGMTLISMPSI